MLATLVALGLAVVTALGLARVQVDTTVASLLPAGDPTVVALGREQLAFGGDPIAVLLQSRQAAQLLSGAPLRQEIALEARLAHLPGAAVVYGPGTTLNEVDRSLQQVLLDIAAERDALVARQVAAAKATGPGAAAAQQAAAAALRTFDDRYTGLLGSALRTGLPTVANGTLGPRLFLAAGGGGRPAFRWLVPDATHVAILVRPEPGLDQAATLALVRGAQRAVAASGLPLRSAIVSGYPVIIAALGHEVTSELPLLGGLSLAVVAAGFLLTRRHRPLWERLVALGTGAAAGAVTLAGFGWAGVHLSLGLLAFLPIILGVGTDYPIYALRQGRPRLIVATAAASAASLAVLAASPLPYVRDLGIGLASGLLASALLGVGVARLLGPTRTAEAPEAAPVAAAGSARLARAVLGGRRRAVATAVAAAALAVAGWVALGGLPLDSDPERLATGLPALQQGIQAQDVLGAAGELDVVVHAPDVLTPQLVSWYGRAQDAVVEAHGDQLRPIVSPASLLSWLGPDATAAQIDAADSLLPPYLTGAAIGSGRSEAVLSFGVRLGSFGADAALVHDIRAELPPLPPGATASISGLPAVAARSYELLAGGRVLPNLAGIGVFALALALALPRRRDAWKAALAAALAVGWGFGVLRLTGTPLSPLTVTLGSLTSAVGGEFAVMAAARVAGRTPRPWAAVVAAAATSIAGFAALAVSRLAVLRQFGVVLAGSVALALLAAWLVVATDDALRGARARQRAHGGQAGGAASPPPGPPAPRRSPEMIEVEA
ncbi:MAG TPA: hypothetical protein VFP61_15030 [Acidimicrobiales bacterium]|nr:hypothetical protein [Acidimicrobiales bacterium]